MIDKEVITINYLGSKIQSASDQIIPITQTSISTHYENAEGDKKSLEQYSSELKEIVLKGIPDDDFDYTFESDTDQLVYINLIKRWKICSRKTIQYGDPIPIEYKPVTIDTGNEFVKPVLSLKPYLFGLYKYDRNAATSAVVTSTFKSLGMKYGGSLNHEQTELVKVWGNPTHSHLRYVTAFGRYLFKKEYLGNKTGSMKSMIAECESDKEEIDRIIRSGYAVHFGNPRLKIKKLLGSLQKISFIADTVESKQKTSNEHCHLKREIRELIVSCENELSNNMHDVPNESIAD